MFVRGREGVGLFQAGGHWLVAYCIQGTHQRRVSKKVHARGPCETGSSKLKNWSPSMMPESSVVLLVCWLARAKVSGASVAMAGPNITWQTPSGERAMALHPTACLNSSIGEADPTTKLTPS